MTAVIDDVAELERRIAAKEFTGMMHTLDKTGDSRTIWDKSNPDEVEVARQQFDTFKRKGYMAYSVKGAKGEKNEQMHEFDQDAERIIFTKPIAGG